MKGKDAVKSEDEEIIISLTNERMRGIPLQYVIGEWDFMGLTFIVGGGVLIPRPETEILCEYIINNIKGKSKPIVIDLCSGSGCIGLSIANFVSDCYVYLIEKSDKAFKYLRKNREKMSLENVTVIQGDIFNVEHLFSILPKADVIVSNPPYIKSSDIPFLQPEVQKEPVMALDGGDDGLVFYRCLCSEWIKHLKEDGVMALECGEDQAESIIHLFKENSFDSKVIKDYNNIDRIVIGGKSDDI